MPPGVPWWVSLLLCLPGTMGVYTTLYICTLYHPGYTTPTPEAVLSYTTGTCSADSGQ